MAEDRLTASGEELRVEAAAIRKAIDELRDLVEDLNSGPWGAAADPQVGIENVIDFILKPALAAADSTERTADVQDQLDGCEEVMAYVAAELDEQDFDGAAGLAARLRGEVV